MNVLIYRAVDVTKPGGAAWGSVESMTISRERDCAWNACELVVIEARCSRQG